MIEVHDGGGSGPVFGNCVCNPNERTTPASSTLPPIPDWCYSPDGQQCNWYRDCLEIRHPCEGTEKAYALRYAEHFCNLYTEHSSQFSANGQKCIDGVRKCLQVKLVPILRIWNDEITCKKIKDIAFDSHDVCYTNPGYGAPSICDLEKQDWCRVFWTMKGSLLSTSTSMLSLSGIIKVAFNCVVHFLSMDSLTDMALLS